MDKDCKTLFDVLENCCDSEETEKEKNRIFSEKKYAKELIEATKNNTLVDTEKMSIFELVTLIETASYLNIGHSYIQEFLWKMGESEELTSYFYEKPDETPIFILKKGISTILYSELKAIKCDKARGERLSLRFGIIVPKFCIEENNFRLFKYYHEESKVIYSHNTMIEATKSNNILFLEYLFKHRKRSFFFSDFIRMAIICIQNGNFRYFKMIVNHAQPVNFLFYKTFPDICEYDRSDFLGYIFDHFADKEIVDLSLVARFNSVKCLKVLTERGIEFPEKLLRKMPAI